MPGFGISLKPLDYVLAAVFVLLLIVSGLYWNKSVQYDLKKAQYDTFVAETKAVGVVADLKGKLTNMKYESFKKESDNEITLARGSLLALANQLRANEKRPRRSLLPTPTPDAGNADRATYDLSDIVDAMAGYTAEMGAIRGEITEGFIGCAATEIEFEGVRNWASKIANYKGD